MASKPGFLSFDPSYLKGITFGLNITDADRKRVVEIARRANPAVIFRQSRKSANKDFALSGNG